MPSPSLWDRLKSARVVQVLAFYLGASWVVLQIADVLADALSLPEWVMPVTVLLLLVGLFISVATAWVQSLPSTTAAEKAGEVPDDWEIAPGDALKSLRSGRLPHLTWGRAIGAGVVALALLFGGTGLNVMLSGDSGVLGPEEAGASIAAEGIAVVPFEVRGEELEVWREGMVDLLSNNLDGVGGFRTIDPRTVMARWNDRVGDAATSTDLDAALRVAGATGARYALVGSLVGTGNQVRLVTNVYDLDSRQEVAQGRAEGPADDILPLADELAVETVRSLLDATGREGAGDITPESLTTQSLAALRHFLDGERHYRRARFGEAVESFESAVAEDSTFVLAMARLGDAYGWLESISSEAGVDWGARALDQADRLPPRLQLYVRAADALVRGSADVLPELREAVQRYPDDPEAWYLLAETLIHVPGGSLASADDAASALEAALALDPDFGPYLLHVADVAVMRGDRATAEATLDRYEELSGSEGLSRAHIELAIPLLLGDSAESVDALARAREATLRTLGLLHGTFGTATDHLDRIEPINDILGEKIGVSRDPWVLWSMGTRGALAEAERYALSAVVPDWAKGIYVGHVANVWGVLPEDPELRAFLEPGACDGNVGCMGFVGYAQVLGERWSAVDATVAELRAAAEAFAAENPDAPPGAAARFVDVVEGMRLLARGQPDGGRDLLEPYVSDGTNAGNLARRALADLALSEGRLNDADRIYNGLLLTFDRSRGLYGKARVAEARGNQEDARRYWNSFAILTAAADAERLPAVGEGRAALARLGQ